MKQPLAGAINLVPRVVHPFQSIIAFKQVDIFAAGEFATLNRTEPRAHRGKADFNSIRLKAAGELEDERPYTADRIGCH